MINVPVNVAYDPTLGFNRHTLWVTVVPAPPPPPAPTLSIEMIATQMWTAGYLMGKNKFTDSVKHKNFPIVQDGHDQGILIPDVTIPPVNLYYPLMWPFSSRAMVFSASTVKLNKKATACAALWPPIPMMTCGNPMKLPVALPILNNFNTFKVGMTLRDFVMGIAKIAVSIVIDLIFIKIGADKKAADAAAGVVAEVVTKSVTRLFFEKLGKSLLPTDPMVWLKKGVSAAAGFTFSVIDGNPTYSVGVGGGPLPSVGVQLGGDPNAASRVGNEFLGVTMSNTPTNDPLHIFTDAPPPATE